VRIQTESWSRQKNESKDWTTALIISVLTKVMIMMPRTNISYHVIM